MREKKEQTPSILDMYRAPRKDRQIGDSTLFPEVIAEVAAAETTGSKISYPHGPVHLRQWSRKHDTPGAYTPSVCLKFVERLDFLAISRYQPGAKHKQF